MRRPLAAFAPLFGFTLVYALAALLYPEFLSWDVLANLVGDNAFLGLAAIGETFVILAGGIDLSVGAVIGFTSILVATLVGDGVPAAAAMPLAVAIGGLFGAGQGALVSFFRLPPFLVTLGGMFLARGLAFVVSARAVPIRDPLYAAIGDVSFRVFPVPAAVLVAVALAAGFVVRSTRFGVALRAIGGRETSARLMGVPVERTRVLVFATSGALAALAGVVHGVYTSSGNASAGMGLELDAIAAVVIGGTALSGGVGGVGGTVLGVLVLGVIQTGIAFEGTLSSWWTRIAIGVLLLAFVLMRKAVGRLSRAASSG
jgi:simple sugar transport system permease protein